MTMISVPEPQHVYPELEFQKAIVALVRNILTEKSDKVALLEHFGLDVAVFFQMPRARTAVRLLEVKSFGGQRLGGVGFGRAKGLGVQVDLLLNGDDSFCLFDETVRWAFADATLPPQTQRYGLFTCLTAGCPGFGFSNPKNTDRAPHPFAKQRVGFETLFL